MWDRSYMFSLIIANVINDLTHSFRHFVPAWRRAFRLFVSDTDERIFKRKLAPLRKWRLQSLLYCKRHLEISGGL